MLTHIRLLSTPDKDKDNSEINFLDTSLEPCQQDVYKEGYVHNIKLLWRNMELISLFYSSYLEHWSVVADRSGSALFTPGAVSIYIYVGS